MRSYRAGAQAVANECRTADMATNATGTACRFPTMPSRGADGESQRCSGSTRRDRWPFDCLVQSEYVATGGCFGSRMCWTLAAEGCMLRLRGRLAECAQGVHPLAH